MQGSENRKKQLVETLCQLGKLIKAAAYYPPGHPALETGLKTCLAAIRPLLQEDNLILTVKKSEFEWDGAPLAKETPILQKLAQLLFARRVHQLLILPDLSSRDLTTFTRCLTMDLNSLKEQGGLQGALLKAQVTTLWVNNIDLNQILLNKEQMEEEKAAAEQQAENETELDEEIFNQPQGAEGEDTPQKTLENLFEELKKEQNEEEYRLRLQKLLPLLEQHLDQENRALCLDILSYLARQAQKGGVSFQARHATESLHLLGNRELLPFLSSSLTQKGVAAAEQESVLKVLRFFESKGAKEVMERLISEQDAQARKNLAQTLILLEEIAIPVLIESLADDRWYVVRNSVLILSDIKSQAALPHLTQLLGHEDVRVRRETIRAITKVGGRQAVGILIKTLELGDSDLTSQALLTLGALKDPAAAPPLLGILQRSGLSQQDCALKKMVIKTLGDIGAPQAIPALSELLGKRRFWNRSRHDELRIAAAKALGDIGGQQTVEALQEAVEDRSAEVARAAANALKQASRG